MPPKSKQRSDSTLGKSLIKAREQQRKGKFLNSQYAQRHQIDPELEYAGSANVGLDSKSKKMMSVVEATHMDDFLDMLDFEERSYEASRLGQAELVAQFGSTMVIEKSARTTNLVYDLVLPIPKRPKWDRSMTKEQLAALEKEAFLDWRREVAKIEEDRPDVEVTPYEKNIEVWKQLWRTVERSHVIVHILDARNPLLYFSKDLVDYALKHGKRVKLLMNKADVLSDAQRETWEKYIEEAYRLPYRYFSAVKHQPKFAVVDQHSESDIVHSKQKLADFKAQDNDVESLTEIDQLLDWLELDMDLVQHETAANSTKPISNLTGRKPGQLVVGMVGFPNVGKSSTINALCRSKRVGVAAQPGKTKHLQTLELSPNVMLCDCPGLVFPTACATKAMLVCGGILPIDQMRDHIGPMTIVANRLPAVVFQQKYGCVMPSLVNGAHELDEEGKPTKKWVYASATEVMQSFGTLRGFMNARGSPDEPRVSRLLLKDYVAGSLADAYAPPVAQDISDWWTEESVRKNASMRIAEGKQHRVHLVDVAELGSTAASSSPTSVPVHGAASASSAGDIEVSRPQNQEERDDREMRGHFDAQNRVQAHIKGKKNNR
nr:large subunit GTPase 1 [Andalucia godoyi]|eukprot:ANDGO_05576.mRNA.1 Large subunit GTPase 1